jgi:uncharacterized membrane protein
MILNLFVILLSLLILDAIYISPQFSSFQQLYKKIQGSPLVVRPLGAVLCYIFLVAELYYFILMNKRPVIDAFILGVCTYGVYNTTNYALLTDFPLRLVFTDTLWGGVLFAVTTWVYYKLKLA